MVAGTNVMRHGAAKVAGTKFHGVVRALSDTIYSVVGHVKGNKMVAATDLGKRLASRW